MSSRPTRGVSTGLAAGLVLVLACGDDAPPPLDENFVGASTGSTTVPVTETAPLWGSEGTTSGGGDGTSASPSGTCGDGVLDPGESCDDSGESASCNADCTPASCGDGVVNSTAGEACDEGGESPACNADCSVAMCGDGLVNAAAGESCDEGGESEHCDVDCTFAECGDGVMNASAGEACDAAGRDGACSDDCALLSCGDGELDRAAGEACDDAGESATCNIDCSVSACGDGIANAAAGEACDDAGSSMTCDADCSPAVCGDGTLNGAAGESCDDGGESATCDADCSVVLCGDGLANATAGEACDDAGDSLACDADCSPAACGDGYLNANAGESCDGGGETAACNDDCSVATCGDGIVNQAAGEECDDQNDDETDGCTSQCLLGAAEFVFLTSSNGETGFYGYTVETDTWETLESPPAVTRSQLTNDGDRVFLLGSDATIYAYDPADDSWTAILDDVPGSVGNPIGFFQWVPFGFYYLDDGVSTMRVYRDGIWSTFDLGVLGAASGTYIAQDDELYIRTYGELGFSVINTVNDAVVRTIENPAVVAENSRTGTYSSGHFYSRTYAGSFQRHHAVSGAVTDTMVTPLSVNTATDADVQTGLIYISGFGADPTSFQVFDPSDNSLATLADQPSVSNHSTITVMRPPPG